MRQNHQSESFLGTQITKAKTQGNSPNHLVMKWTLIKHTHTHTQGNRTTTNTYWYNFWRLKLSTEGIRVSGKRTNGISIGFGIYKGHRRDSILKKTFFKEHFVQTTDRGLSILLHGDLAGDICTHKDCTFDFESSSDDVRHEVQPALAHVEPLMRRQIKSCFVISS